MSGRAIKLGLALAIAGACAVVAGARLTLSKATTRSNADRRTAAPGLQLHVPRATAPIAIDAEIEGKKVWEGEAGSTLNFKDDAGKGMVPYTEAKVRWGDGKLYFLLYAGDLDLEGTVKEADGPVSKDDSFRLEIGPPDATRVIEVSVLGTVADSLCPAAGRPCDTTWQSHAVVAVDRDGTLNQLGDNDEEWVVEMAVPFDALAVPNPRPGTRIPIALHRCDVGRDGPHACGGWGTGSQSGELILDP
jgi:hypothetical protein